VTGLTTINIVVILAGLVTGPITARSLGPAGRGELAAIVAVLLWAPLLLDFGLTQWIARERATGATPADILGVALPLAFACSLIGVAGAVPVSHAIGAGRPVVTAYVQAGLFLIPITVIMQTLLGIVIGESRWGLLAASRITGSLMPVVAIVVLAAIGRLTVATAAASYLLGTLISGLLVMSSVRGVGRLFFERHRARLAAAFGAKIWLSSLAAAGTNRIDQVLMAFLVPSSELGLYAVAVTVATVALSPIGMVVNVLVPRVAAGDARLAARACRVSTAVVGIASLALIAGTPILIPFVFGSKFRPAEPMAIVLLIANIPAAAGFLLNSALGAANNPGATVRAELVGLVATVAGLIVFLPEFGGRGAAAVSLAAYSLRLIMQLTAVRGTFGYSWWRFVIPTREDVRWAGEQARALLRRRSRSSVPR
jgi:O-antigen/teichoic acid export membrane protein